MKRILIEIFKHNCLRRIYCIWTITWLKPYIVHRVLIENCPKLCEKSWALVFASQLSIEHWINIFILSVQSVVDTQQHFQASEKFRENSKVCTYTREINIEKSRNLGKEDQFWLSLQLNKGEACRLLAANAWLSLFFLWDNQYNLCSSCWSLEVKLLDRIHKVTKVTWPITLKIGAYQWIIFIF